MPAPLHAHFLWALLVRCLAIVLLTGWTAAATAGTFVQFRTIFGDLHVELLDEDKPATVQNFLRYVRNGFYQNVFLHRCIPNFVVQGGEYITLNRGSTSLFAAEHIYAWPNFPPLTNEFSVGRTFSNTYGTLAMARLGGQTNSATSQWFFNLGDNSELDAVDGGFTVFGLVRGGTNVLEFFNSLSRNNGIINMQNYSLDPFVRTVFTDLPVRYAGSFQPELRDLIYVDISLLAVTMETEPSGSRIIRWNSVRDRPNRVEYTDSFPPIWNTLAITNGTGSGMTVTDESSHAPARFYRVTIDY